MKWLLAALSLVSASACSSAPPQQQRAAMGNLGLGGPGGPGGPGAMAPSAPAPSPPPPAPTALQRVLSRPVEGGSVEISVNLSWPDPPSGPTPKEQRLAIGWLRADELGPQGPTMKGVISLMGRMTVLDVHGVPGRGVARIGVPPEPVALFAVLDRERRFLPTLFGRSVPSNAMRLTEPRGYTRGAEALVQLAAPAAAGPQAERCQGDRLELLEVPAPGVLGSSPGEVRRLCVRLPASYAKAARKRYPVIYVLPGLAGSDTAAITGNDDLGTVLDQLAVEVKREAILVGVDTSSPFGSSYFTDSPLHGPWERFGASTMVKAVDAKYRTHATPQGRALAGHSTGGFDAVSLAMRHPEVFRAVAASSPDALDLDGWLWDQEGKLRKTWLGWMRTEDAMKGAGQLSSYAAAWSPDPTTPGGLLWPADLVSGAKQQPGEALWRKASPASWLETKEGLERAKKLTRRIVITCGKADEASLFEPTERYVEALRKKGIEVTWLPTELGHLGPKRPRFEPMLKFLLATMQPSR